MDSPTIDFRLRGMLRLSKVTSRSRVARHTRITSVSMALITTTIVLLVIDAYLPVGPNAKYPLPAPTGTATFCDNASASECTSTPPTAGFISPYSKLYNTPNVSNVLTARVDSKLFRNNDATFGFQYGNKN